MMVGTERYARFFFESLNSSRPLNYLGSLLDYLLEGERSESDTIGLEELGLELNPM